MKPPKNVISRSKGWMKKIFHFLPNREIHIRTNGNIKFLKLTSQVQVLGLFVLLIIFTWTTFSVWRAKHHIDQITEKERHLSNARLAYHSLLGDVADYQRKFTAVTDDLESNHALMLGLVEKNVSLKDKLKNVSKKLIVTETDRQSVRNAREILKGTLSNIENQLRDTANKNFSLEGSLTMVENDLHQALSERNKALFDGTAMRQKIGNLENNLEKLQNTHEDSIIKLNALTAESINSFKKMVELTGINLKAFPKTNSKKFNVSQGGPFIPTKSSIIGGKRLQIELEVLEKQINEWRFLKNLMATLPLISPLKSYYITSNFGKRKDPINKRWSAHYGLDMGSQIKSNVFSPTTGTVSFSGWKKRYGRMVEINHSKDIKTRYGHLKKILVKKGQKVKVQQKIGLLGNSGRSTGPHLHYEILFRGKPMNPKQFIKAGRYVFKN